LKGPAINTYTVRVHEPELDELDAASSLGAALSAPRRRSSNDFRQRRRPSRPIQNSSPPRSPCHRYGLRRFASAQARVHSCGQKVVLTGEGGRMMLVGYPWLQSG